MRAARFFIIICVVLAVVAGGGLVFAGWQPAIDPVERPAASGFAPALVQRGAELAAIGNCDVCHTAPGGRAFAGGRGIPTPFGTIFSTNITPDVETGIGNWSEAAFGRAMRAGVRRDGAYLYPAFPYDHFTLVSDDDDQALYAFLMTRDAVGALPPQNDLKFPANMRPVMFAWNLLFLHRGPYRADTAHDNTWNRGAYLVEGLGHCGACHTPRNFLGAEKRSRHFAGGEAEGWTAYALNASSPAPLPWNSDTLARYLRTGFAEAHGVARGPMAEVVQDLRGVARNDVQAIAAYIAAQTNAGAAPAATVRQADAQAQRGRDHTAASADSHAVSRGTTGDTGDQGALIYAAACASCHEGPRAMPYGGIDLALSSAVSGPTAQNLVHLVLYGLPASESARSPIMPGFAATMSDQQVVALVNYLRGHYSDKAAWSDVEASVRAARNASRVGMNVVPNDGAAKAER